MNVVVKKIRAYPIDAQLVDTGGPIPGKIVKLVPNGCLVETLRPLPMGHGFNVTFTIPVFGNQIQALGIVVKGYTRMGGVIGGAKADALTELHFKGMSPENSEAVVAFLKKVGQAK